jgi:hypothetical protein
MRVKRERGTGYIVSRGGSWYIGYSFKGRPYRESVAKALGKPVSACTKADAEQLLALRLRLARTSPFVTRMTTSLEEAAVIARVNELAAPSSPLLIGGAELRRLVGPIVYAYFRRWTPFYVGMSRHGVARPFLRTHHRLKPMWQQRNPLKVGTEDHVVIWPMRSVEEAAAFERVVAATLLGAEWMPTPVVVSRDPQELFGI